MPFLTGDLGNSRCKLRLWDERAPGLLAGSEFRSEPGLGAEVSAWLARHPPAEGFAVCSVASAELEEELVGALAAASGGARARSTTPAPGLSVACREPARVGRDRLFAARGALEVCRGDAIVVDAGTALTVDAVRSDGTFLGGAIAPGPALLADALARGTARLPRIDPRPGVPALGRDTEAALQAGVVVGFRGAARELVERVGEESGLESAAVVVTGGARRFLLDPALFPTASGARRVLEQPDLVHLGLLAASGQGAR